MLDRPKLMAFAKPSTILKPRILFLFFLTALAIRCSQPEELFQKEPDGNGKEETIQNASARFGVTLSDYDQAVLSDQPVAFWNAASGTDLTANGYNGSVVNNPATTILPNGERVLSFNGSNQYVEVPSTAAFSVPTTGVLTLEAWVRPDVLDFNSAESSGYVNWMGKGTTGSHEYTARMYTQYPTGNDAGRKNRITGNVFSLNGTGSGSYYQASADWPIQAAEWIHYVITINTTATASYPHGYTKLTIHRQDVNGTVVLFESQNAIGSAVVPAAGNTPLRIGTRDLKSYFQGAIGKVAIYDHELSNTRALAHAEEMFNYDSYVLADHPVAFWNDASGEDLTLNEFDGIRINNPGTTTMPNGDLSPVFDIDKYIEVASAPEFSVPTTGVLTLESWIRPDKLDFDRLDGTGYVHWMGKGDRSAGTNQPGNREYVARMYGRNSTGEDEGRINRISGYVYNPAGGEGAGSYYQASADWRVQAGEWIHVTFIINTNVQSAEYPTGFTKLYIHRRTSDGSIVSFTDKDNLIDYNITAVAGNAPFRIGTRDAGQKSYFQGAIGKVAIYNYELSGERSRAHAVKMFD